MLVSTPRTFPMKFANKGRSRTTFEQVPPSMNVIPRFDTPVCVPVWVVAEDVPGTDWAPERKFDMAVGSELFVRWQSRGHRHRRKHWECSDHRFSSRGPCDHIFVARGMLLCVCVCTCIRQRCQQSSEKSSISTALSVHQASSLPVRSMTLLVRPFDGL